MIEAQVRSMFEYLLKRFSTEVTYKRFRFSSYDPDSGETKTFWETVTFQAVAFSSRLRALPIEGGLLEKAEVFLAFPRNVFTKQSGELAEPTPKLGDEIIFWDKTWEPAEHGRKPIFWEDPSKTLFFLGVKGVES